MKIGKFIFKRVLNKRQREVILKALIYSAHTYKRRGEMEGYSEVSRVVGELSDKFGLKERTYTEQEVKENIEQVSKIIAGKTQEFIKRAFRDGFAAGAKSVSSPIVVGFDSGESFKPLELSKKKVRILRT